MWRLRSRSAPGCGGSSPGPPRALGYTVHNGGTYVNMDGPAFSTRAESESHRKMGFDVIGMTNGGGAAGAGS